jgi:hypothetical protein
MDTNTEELTNTEIVDNTNTEEFDKNQIQDNTKDTDITKVLDKKYEIGEYITYYKIDKENRMFSTSTGLIKKNILDNLYIVFNTDTYLHEKISHHHIIEKIENINNTPVEEFLEYVLDNCDIIFLYVFLILELIVICGIYIYFNNTSLYTHIVNVSETVTDFVNHYIYKFI